MAWQSIPAEQSVLGGLLLAPDAWPDVAGVLHWADFVKRKHQLIYGAIRDLLEATTPLDVVTLAEQLEGKRLLNDAGGLAYLGALAKDTPSAANVRAYAEIVADCAKRRRLRELFTVAAERIQSASDIGELLGEIVARAENINAQGTAESLSFAEAWSQSLNAMDDAANAESGIAGVPTGLPAIDKRTGGLLPRRLIVLAARPSIGKTALAQQIALHAAENGHAVGICSLEMSATELMQRSMANRYGLNVSALTFGNETELRELTQAACTRPIASLPIWIDADTYSLGGIVARLSEWRRKHRIALGIIDHIGLIDGDEGSTRNDHLGKITRTLKLVAKRLGIPILAVSQLSRNVERDKRRPVLADLRDSGSIEQDADVAIFLHVDPNEERTSSVHLDIGLLKNRIGTTGWLPERFTFDGRKQRIQEIEPYE
ncbi:MAG: AAA family ATPase [Gammaproteobacteria bacterium]|nr:AAA family ATPase [Gammaproteobacteria bacterium]